MAWTFGKPTYKGWEKDPNQEEMEEDRSREELSKKLRNDRNKDRVIRSVKYHKDMAR